MALNPARVFLRPDLAQVLRLVGEAGLPIDDLDEADLGHFLGLGPRNRPLGVVGLELLGATALLRSLAVDSSARGAGSGTALVEAAEGHAIREGVETLYLLTTTADRFFERLGYARVAREKAPPEIRRTREFSELCSETAVLMMKDL
jgi:amino-acid N-acetyltransferase